MQEDWAGIESILQPVWEIVDPWLRSGDSRLHVAAIAGEFARGTGQALFASDLTHLLLPGLAAFGITGRLAEASASDAQVRSPATKIVSLGIAGSLNFAPPEEIDGSTPVPVNTDPMVLLPFEWPDPVVPRSGPSSLPGAGAHSLELPAAHLLFLTPAAARSPRRADSEAALHRWLAWYAAYSPRAPRNGDKSDPAGTRMAEFLHGIIGSRHDRLANRLRYAAGCFADADISQAYRWMLEAGLFAWELPAAPARAILTLEDQPLSDPARRELIYLARAGVPELKAIAARRLTAERRHTDARATLHQLCFDTHPWVRAAARH